MSVEISVTDDLATCRALRRAVFIEEQGVSEADEIDDLDGEAIHLIALQDGAAVGTARLLRRGDKGKIGRVCVLAQARGAGIGAGLIRSFPTSHSLYRVGAHIAFRGTVRRLAGSKKEGGSKGGKSHQTGHRESPVPAPFTTTSKLTEFAMKQRSWAS